jgi:release factor glutamine methyltransferase
MKAALLQKRYIRSSRLICYLLFGFFPSPQNRKTLWDNTSLVLKKAILKWIEKNDIILEVGSGDIGLLSNFLDRKINAEITSVDICGDFIENAKKNRKKESKIKFIESDLYSNLDKTKKFDIIFSNPPYVKTSLINLEGHMQYHGFRKKEMLFYASDGGEHGTELISRLLNDSSSFLNSGGSLLIGYNQKHIEEKRIIELIDQSEFYIKDTFKSPRTTCKVLNLEVKSG